MDWNDENKRIWWNKIRTDIKLGGNNMYIKYLLKNTEPIRITNASTSQNEQMDSLTYIPGTTIRGMIINTLAFDPEFCSNFAEIKQKLFSNQVQYQNAYLAKKQGESYVELIPSPKGFYENKTTTEGQKKIENVVKDGNVSPGLKRAGLGRYCQVKDQCIFYSNVELGDDMRVDVGRRNERNIFRNQYIQPKQYFCGYVKVEEESLAALIKTVLEKAPISIGNSRSAGYGTCEIVKVSLEKTPSYYDYTQKEDVRQNCYLYLMSDTVMRNEEGELTGLDLPTLEAAMGVKQLKIEFCSTTTVNIKGYNRMWGTKIPDAVMYQMGSVFQLSYEGEFKKERIEALCQEGIGIRRNEGFGQILVWDKKQYEGIQAKQKLEEKKAAESSLEPLTNEDREVLKIAAKGYYLEEIERKKNAFIVDFVENSKELKNIKSTQLGNVAAYASALKYNPEEAKKQLYQYLQHAVNKYESSGVHQDKGDPRMLQQFVKKICETDLDEQLGIHLGEFIMGIPKKELLENPLKIKLQMIIDIVRYCNKEKK